MKTVLLTALFVIIAASWCLAQTDSVVTPAPAPCQPAACSEPCQPGACAMTCQPFVPKWAVGLKTNTISDLPGSVIVEKMFGLNNSFRLIVNGDYHTMDEYQIYKNWWVRTGVKWYHRFNINRLKFLKPSFGLGLIYTREEFERQYFSASDYRKSTYNNAVVCIPFALTHDFKVADNNFAIGVEADIFTVQVDQDNQQERNIFTGRLYDLGTATNVQTYLFSKPSLTIKYLFK